MLNTGFFININYLEINKIIMSILKNYFKQNSVMHSFSSCQWPIGDPQEKDFHFCEADTVAGKPYCQNHCDVAYIDEKELKNLEKRDDGKFEIIDVKLDSRKTKSLNSTSNKIEESKKIEIISENFNLSGISRV